MYLKAIAAIVCISVAPWTVLANNSVWEEEIEIFQNQPATTSATAISYPNNLKLREKRKMGIGAGVGGTLGHAGLNFELNIEDADGVVAGFGGGKDFGSFQLAWKHVFAGQFLSPYLTAGYSRWYNSSNGKNFEGTSGVLNRVLTDSEKATGIFAKDFMNASVGLQYNQLSGPMSGISVYGELNAMYEVSETMFLPNGSVGAFYYF